MNVELLYPDPPHLSLSVWAPAQERESFAAAGRAVLSAGGRPTGVLRSFPAGTRFERPSEITRQPEFVGDRFPFLVAGADADNEVVEAGYLRSDDLIVVQRAPGTRDEIHPVRETMHAGIFSIPTDLWSDEDWIEAAGFAAWLRPLFRDTLFETGALYGLIQQEAEAPTPSQLLADGQIIGDLFVSRVLLDDDRSLLSDLRHLRPTAEEEDWPTGMFFPTYGPFRSDRATQTFDHARDRARALRLGEAVQRFLSPS